MKIDASQADADDAAQEAMADFFRATAVGREIQKPDAYVRKAARHALFRLATRARRDDPLDAAHSTLAGYERDNPTLLHEEELRVVALLDCLPLAQREVVALHYDDFSHAEIAEIVGKSADTVRSLLRFGRARLKEVLRSSDDLGLRT